MDFVVVGFCLRYGSSTEPGLCGFKVQSSVSSTVRITGVNHHTHCWRSKETSKGMKSRSKFENKFLNVTVLLSSIEGQHIAKHVFFFLDCGQPLQYPTGDVEGRVLLKERQCKRFLRSSEIVMVNIINLMDQELGDEPLGKSVWDFLDTIIKVGDPP